MNKFENLIESKVSRGELLDMMTHELADDIRAAKDALEESRRALDEYTFDEVKPVLEKHTADVNVRHYKSRSDGEKLTISVECSIPLSTAPAALRKHVAEYLAIDKDLDEARDSLQRIHSDRGALKSRMLRGMLAESAEGKELLKLLDGMKASARKQLRAGARQLREGGDDGE